MKTGKVGTFVKARAVISGTYDDRLVACEPLESICCCVNQERASLSMCFVASVKTHDIRLAKAIVIWVDPKPDDAAIPLLWMFHEVNHLILREHLE
jgi:hypothetical protein